jgi:hypothetical protein
MGINEQLTTLEVAELIRRASIDQELAYLFRHAMVQEAAYGSLVRADRKRLHRAAAEALEGVYAPAGQPVSGEIAALLAQHYHNAGEPRAQHFATLAAQAALARYANAEAVTYFNVALDWALRGAESEPLRSLYTARGRALELIGKFAEALENYQALEAAGRAREDRRLVLQALVLQGKLRSTVNPMFDPAEGYRLGEVALALAQALNDQEAQSKIHWNALNLHRFAGNMTGARISGELSLALARAAGAAEQEAATLNDMLHVYGALGQWDQHRAAATEAAERWRSLGNMPMLADSLSTTAMYAAMRGDYDLALTASAEAGQIALSINNLWGQAYCLSGAAMAHWYRGQYAAAIGLTRECLRLAGLAGYWAAFTLNGSQLAAMLIDAGQIEMALAEARAAFDFAEAHIPSMRTLGVGILALAQMGAGQLSEAEATLARIPLDQMDNKLWMAGQMLRAHGELAVALRSPDAIRMGERRLAAVRAFAVPPLETEALLTLAQALRLAGQFETAHARLLEARAVAEALAMRRLQWPIGAELAGLAAEAGDEPAAAALRSEALAVVRAIAAEMPEPGMRATFEQAASQLMQARAYRLMDPPQPAKKGKRSAAKAAAPASAKTKPRPRKKPGTA